MSEGCKQGSPASVQSLEARLTLFNRVEELKRLQSFVDEFCKSAGLSRETQHAIDLSLTEWLTNVISYGLDPGTGQTIDVRMSWNGAEVEIEVIDPGRPFDPVQHADVDTSVPLEEKPIGGLGIHLMRKMMDRINHDRVDGRNRLVMTKAVAVPPSKSN